MNTVKQSVLEEGLSENFAERLSKKNIKWISSTNDYSPFIILPPKIAQKVKSIVRVTKQGVFKHFSMYRLAQEN